MLPYTSFITGRKKKIRRMAATWAGCNGACRGLSGTSDRAEAKGVSEGCPSRAVKIGYVIWEQWNNPTVVLDLNLTKEDKTIPQNNWLE